MSWWNGRPHATCRLPCARGWCPSSWSDTSRFSPGGPDISFHSAGWTASRFLLLGSKNRPAWGILISAALLGWLIWTGAAKHPDYLAYFNELAGREPEKVLVDSDLDWGQDFNRLARRLHVLGATEVHFSTLVP